MELVQNHTCLEAHAILRTTPYGKCFCTSLYLSKGGIILYVQNSSKPERQYNYFSISSPHMYSLPAAECGTIHTVSLLLSVALQSPCC